MTILVSLHTRTHRVLDNPDNNTHYLANGVVVRSEQDRGLSSHINSLGPATVHRWGGGGNQLRSKLSTRRRQVLGIIMQRISTTVKTMCSRKTESSSEGRHEDRNLSAALHPDHETTQLATRHLDVCEEKPDRRYFKSNFLQVCR